MVLDSGQVRALAQHQVRLAERRRKAHARVLFDRPQHVLAVPVPKQQRPGSGRIELADEFQGTRPVPEPGTRPAHIEAGNHEQEG
jgi:hypothetical protein